MTSFARVAAVVALVGVVLGAAPSPGHAQTSVDEGIDAFVRRDYTRAADALRPLAEQWPFPPSAAAAFFMAAMYENGLGMPQDPIKACALYVMADAGTDAGGRTFQAISQEMVRSLQASLSPDQFRMCVLLANVGFGHSFEAATFHVGPEHWVDVQLGARDHAVTATVSHKGRARTFDVMPLLTGMVFEPLEYTELEVGGTTPHRRHFLQAAAWVPLPDGAWSLMWSLSEIVNGELVTIEHTAVATTDGGFPMDERRQVRRWVALGHSAAGDPQFAILDGPDARAQVIPSEAARREMADDRQRRDAAEKRVDWSKEADPARQPSLAYADTDGCGNALLFGWAADRTEALAVRVDKDMLQLSNNRRVFDLSSPSPDLDVSIEVFNQPHKGFCDDVPVTDENARRETWRAVGGTVTVQLTEPGVRASDPSQYKASVEIANAEFQSSTGDRIRMPAPLTVTAFAGGSGPR